MAEDATGERVRIDAARRARLQTLLVAQRDDQPTATTLALQVGDEVGRWMATRGASWRTLDVNSATLARCLKGGDVKLSSVAALAEALGCDAMIHFVPRWRGAFVDESTPLSGDSSRCILPINTVGGNGER